MKVVIDSNRVLAAMIKDSTTREILLDPLFEFIAPDFILSEVRNYKERVTEIAEIDENEFDILLALIFEHITIIPEIGYREFIDSMKNEISDPKDLPYIAACLASNAQYVWTHDPHFDEQNKIKKLTNIDLLKISGKSKSY